MLKYILWCVCVCVCVCVCGGGGGGGGIFSLEIVETNNENNLFYINPHEMMTRFVFNYHAIANRNRI